MTDGTYTITSAVVAPGDSAAGGGYAMQATVGQPAQGLTKEASYLLQAGFWSGYFPQLAGLGRNNIFLMVLPAILANGTPSN